MINEIDKIAFRKDLIIFHELLNYDEPRLAIEFICDKIFECDLVIPERLGKMLQLVTAKLEIEPARSWWPIVIEESESHQLRRLCVEGSDLVGQTQEVFNRVKQYLTPRMSDLINEFLHHEELELAMDDLCHCLIDIQIPVLKKDVDKLRSIWLDMGYDPSEWTGFNIQDE
jgi:hypothetical protein